MYEEEEQRLLKFKKEYEKVELPIEQGDEAILSGFMKAKREKSLLKKKQKRLLGLAIAAIIIVSFITSIRISPTFANALTSIPGMEWMIGFIEQDKGFSAIIENDYYQKVDVSETKGDLTLTIDGVIMDESGINVFYTLKSTNPLTGGEIKYINLLNKEEFPEHTRSYNVYFPDDIQNEFQDMVEYQFVEIENQKITIEEIIVYPLRIGVKVAVDPTNTKEILGFEDMRLEDENGEVWTSIANGTVNRTLSKHEKMYYLQSNYFEKPKELYLRVNKLMAIDKEDAVVIVDTEANRLVKSPKDGKLKLGETSKAQAEFFMVSDSEDMYTIFDEPIDATGKELSIPSTEFYNHENKKYWNMFFENSEYKNPLQMKLTFYPNYIEGDVKIEVK